MKLQNLIYVVLTAAMAPACSCSSHSEPAKQEMDPARVKEQLVKVNQYEVAKESDEIDQYVAHRNWPMQKTGTGLRYMFMKKGNGKPVQPGDRVKVNYKITLLDGTVCYSSDQDGPYEFTVEGDAVERGLHEAIQLMRTGDQTRFILPSYLAHGVHGDDANIPPLSAIIVELELLEIK